MQLCCKHIGREFLMLKVCVEKKIGDLNMNVGFAIEKPVITALLGKSGAGKTTLANMLSGLVKPDSGVVFFNDDVFFDGERRVNLPPEERGIGYVFQEHRLFPHLSVRHNLTFGRWAGGRKNSEKLSKIVELLELGRLLDRRPDTLSGGESQRVAIGRALYACTSFLIMDEPLSSLDAALKESIMDYIAMIPKNFSFPMIYITHDQKEVDRLAEETLSLEGGRIGGGA